MAVDTHTDPIAPVCEALVAACATVLDPTPARAFFAAGGPPAWDNCCEGQTWVRVAAIRPHLDGSNRQSARFSPCGVAYWEVTLGVGVLRCAVTLDAQGNAPSAEALNSEGRAMSGDVAALRDAILCNLPEISGVLPNLVRVERWDPLGPQGGCVGGEWTATVGIGGCPCPEE